jgi:hypothetical protein
MYEPLFGRRRARRARAGFTVHVHSAGPDRRSGNEDDIGF